jgi:polyvinyl alcohol dehydrogenase (cytochrome)
MWEFDMAREFETINKVPARGGSMIAPGVTVAAGMVYVGSGYSVFGDNPGNVILAFSTE